MITIAILLSVAALQEAPPAPAIFMPQVLPPAEGGRDAFDRALRSSVDGPVIDAIERHFPEDSRRFVDQLYAGAAASPDDREALIRHTQLTMRAYIASKRAELFKAPASSLLALNARILALYEGLSRNDVALCARLAVSGVRDGTLFPEAVRSEYRAVTLATIETAGAGRGAGAVARSATPARQHLDAWLGQMRALDPSGEVMGWVEGRAGTRAAPAEIQCRSGIMTHQAIARIDPEGGASLLASLMNHNLGG
jgi:hypothetical protein